MPGQRKRGSKEEAPAKTKKPKGLKALPVPTPAPPNNVTSDPDEAMTKKLEANVKDNFKPAHAPPNDTESTMIHDTPIPLRGGFRGKESIERFGTIQDVTGDGNCGYYAAQEGLRRLNIEHETNITSFRKSLYDHAKQQEDKFLCGGDDWKIYTLGFKAKNGKTAAQLRLEWWNKEVVSKIWKEDVAFEKGVAAYHYLDSDAHWPILADKFGVNVVCYNTRSGDLFTSAYELQDNGLKYKITVGFKSPSELGLDKSTSSTVQIVHVNSNHFMSVAMK